MAKLLSTRLRSVQLDVINVNQYAFIVRRQILDGFMIANEVVHGIRNKMMVGKQSRNSQSFSKKH
jgi:hypothetical protein